MGKYFIMNFNILFLLFQLPTIGKPKFTGKKRQYTPEPLTKAYQEVTGHCLSIHKAAKLYGIPDSTFKDRFRGGGEHFNQHQKLMKLDSMFFVVHQQHFLILRKGNI